MAINQEEIKKSKSPSKFFQLPSFILNTLALLFVSVVVSIIIEWVGIFFEYWNEDGALHAKHIFTTELNWVLGDLLSNSQNLTKLYSFLFIVSDEYLLENSGLKELANGQLSLMLLWVLMVSVFFHYLANYTEFRDDVLLRVFVKILGFLPILFLITATIDVILEINILKDYIFAMIYIIQLTIVRLLTIIFALPTFILLTLYIVADGLYQRQIRKLSGMMESSFIYHHSKRWIKPLIGLPIVLLLASPIAIHPSIFVLVVTLTPGIFILISIKYFKKYL